MANGLCRIDGTPLNELADFGEQFVSDFVAEKDIHKGTRASLRVGIGSNSGVVQLYESIPPENLYKRYWYRSGINESMRTELRSIVESTSVFVDLKPGDTVLDIASNDGTLLSNYGPELNRVGIDPSNVAAESSVYEENGIELVNDFFSAPAFRSVTQAKAKIVTVIAMFYDLEKPQEFLSDIREIIEEDGVFVIQIAYTPLSLEQNEFGNFVHEHLCYYDFQNLNALLDDSGFEVFDVEINAANGGSIRVYSTPKGNVSRLACPLNYLSIGDVRKRSIIEYESKMELQGPEPYERFTARVEKLKNSTLKWLQDRAERGETVIGYGASTKGNSLLQYYGITPELLPYIAERSEEKWGLYTIGSGIPIISEVEMRKMRPDYLFALPWFFIRSFLNRETDLLASGTKFVMPQPQLRVLGNE